MKRLFERQVKDTLRKWLITKATGSTMIFNYIINFILMNYYYMINLQTIFLPSIQDAPFIKQVSDVSQKRTYRKVF